MGKIFRFLDFPVYKVAKNLYKQILKVVNELPRECQFTLGDQSRRAALSISLNIAEGSGKDSDKEFGRYLRISLGSINELAACLDIMKDNKLIKKEEYNELISQLEECAKQINSLKKILKK